MNTPNQTTSKASATLTRKDGKKPNIKKSPDTVAIVKALHEQGIPPLIISFVYDINESTVLVWALGHRQKDVNPCDPRSAKRDFKEKFQEIIGD